MMKKEQHTLQISVRDWGRVRTLLRRCADALVDATDETKKAVQVLLQDKMDKLVLLSTEQGGEGECIVVIKPSGLLEVLPNAIRFGALSDLRGGDSFLTTEQQRLARYIIEELRGGSEVGA
jgi:hypothetical protein